MAHHPTQPVAHYTTKQRLRTSGGLEIPAASRRLAAIYSLLRHPVESTPPGPAVQSERLSRRAALIELLPHMFRMDLTDRSMLIRQLDFLEHVVTLVPVYRLHYPSSFDTLAQVRQPSSRRGPDHMKVDNEGA